MDPYLAYIVAVGDGLMVILSSFGVGGESDNSPGGRKNPTRISSLQLFQSLSPGVTCIQTGDVIATFLAIKQKRKEFS